MNRSLLDVIELAQGDGGVEPARLLAFADNSLMPASLKAGLVQLALVHQLVLRDRVRAVLRRRLRARIRHVRLDRVVEVRGVDGAFLIEDSALALPSNLLVDARKVRFRAT